MKADNVAQGEQQWLLPPKAGIEKAHRDFKIDWGPHPVSPSNEVHALYPR